MLGSDTLTIPCYLAQGPDDPGLEAWKRDHPDWFEAGLSTETAGLAPADGARSGGTGAGTDRPSLDPASTSASIAPNGAPKRLKPAPGRPAPDAPG